MPTQETERQAAAEGQAAGPERPGVGPAAKEVAEHASALARLELELAGLELKRKVTALGVGIGLLVGAAVFLFYALGFGFAAGAAALALALPMWAALLIVFGALVLIALVLGLSGVNLVKKGTPPVPEQAVTEAKLTTEALRRNGDNQ
jgi:Putative Actinobacterial Holin-X, holin superfamily III